MRPPRAAAARAPDTAQLWNELAAHAAGPRVLCAVAWSGGLDSTVLMHLLAGLRRQHPRRLVLRALHVDHHLQPAAAQFRAQCRRLARAWAVPLDVLDVQVHAAAGASLEEAARDARYAAWEGALRPGEILLVAQHADDQVETLLLALLRGAGPAGLAAMPRVAPLGRGTMLRPLLDLPRAALHEYAARQGLTWADDPSNQQLRFDRNYLRAEVVPRLRQRWPAVAQTLARSARHCAAAAAALGDLATIDLDSAADGAGLDMAVLRRWTAPRQLAVLRAWFARAGLRSPETRHLAQVQAMLVARVDAHPQLQLAEAIVRVHESRLLLELRRPAVAPLQPSTWQWRRAALELPGGLLAVRPDAHGDVDLSRLPPALDVRSLATTPARGRSLRKLLQELAVPHWEREGLPLLHAHGREAPIAVADLWVHPEFAARPGSTRRGRIVWRPKP